MTRPIPDRAKRSALQVVELDARRLRALLRLCDPARHGGAELAVRASAFLGDLLAVLEREGRGAPSARRAASAAGVARRKGKPSGQARRTGGRATSEAASRDPNDRLDDLWWGG